MPLRLGPSPRQGIFRMWFSGDSQPYGETTAAQTCRVLPIGPFVPSQSAPLTRGRRTRSANELQPASDSARAPLDKRPFVAQAAPATPPGIAVAIPVGVGVV